MITFKQVSFGYRGGRLFEGLDLELRQGAIYGLLGKNGAGKSTLLKLISGLLFPKAGEITVLNHTPGKREVDFLSQVFLLPEEFDLPRQEELFARVTTRGGADAYDGPAFPLVCATAGFRGVMGNPFMLTAIALAFKRGSSIDSHSVWETFSEINRKFRKRTKLEDYDKAAVKVVNGHYTGPITIQSESATAAGTDTGTAGRLHRPVFRPMTHSHFPVRPER